MSILHWRFSVSNRNTDFVFHLQSFESFGRAIEGYTTSVNFISHTSTALLKSSCLRLLPIKYRSFSSSFQMDSFVNHSNLNLYELFTPPLWLQDAAINFWETNGLQVVSDGCLHGSDFTCSNVESIFNSPNSFQNCLSYPAIEQYKANGNLSQNGLDVATRYDLTGKGSSVVQLVTGCFSGTWIGVKPRRNVSASSKRRMILVRPCCGQKTTVCFLWRQTASRNSERSSTVRTPFAALLT